MADRATPTVQGPEDETAPQTVREKLEWLIRHAFPPGEAPWGPHVPSSRDLAAAINDFHGRTAVSHPTISKMRGGQDPDNAPEYVPGDKIMEDIAQFFDVDPLFFQPRHEVVNKVIETLKFLTAVHRGDVDGLAARGVTDEGMSAELLAYLNEITAEFSQDPLAPE